jgi:hypothetical protein
MGWIDVHILTVLYINPAFVRSPAGKGERMRVVAFQDCQLEVLVKRRVRDRPPLFRRSGFGSQSLSHHYNLGTIRVGALIRINPVRPTPE